MKQAAVLTSGRAVKVSGMQDEGAHLEALLMSSYCPIIFTGQIRAVVVHGF